MLRYRILSALIAGPLVLLLVWLGEGWTTALVALGAALALNEFHRLTVRRDATLLLFLGIIACVLLVVQATVEMHFLGPLLAGAVVATLMLLVLLPQKERLLADWGWTLAGVMLIGYSLSHAILIRKVIPDGREWLFSLVLLTFAVDTGAYAMGRLVGRRRMAPTISPRKTWEGAAGGTMAGMGAAVALDAVYGLGVSIPSMLVLGALIAIFAQLGDLSLSVVKRAAGAKESGALIPGHGGILDRVDSLIPAVLVLYYFLVYGIGAA